MTEVFIEILNMSVAASWLIPVVLLARLIFKKAPKWINILLWGLVGLRLCLPFGFESVMSLVPSAETVSPEIMMDPTPEIHSGVSSVNSIVNPVLSVSFAPFPGTSMNPLQFWLPLGAIVWGLGILTMVTYAAVSFAVIKRRVKTAVCVRDNIWAGEKVFSPFVLGLFRPKIYVPTFLEETELSHVLAHEQAHIKRKDHLWKPLGWLILSVHWFNPLVWVGYILLCRDIELACDEKVVSGLEPVERADYSEVLLSFAKERRRIAACPLAFGEVSVKTRVKSVLSYKKPALWIIIGSLALCAVIALCFLTNRPSDRITEKNYLPLEDVKTGYSALDAAKDGCVVLDGSSLLEGEEIWLDFVQKSAKGERSQVRIYQMYSSQGENYYVKDIFFDGERYILQYYDSYSDSDEEFLFSEEYSHLVRSPYQTRGQYSDCYILGNSPNLIASDYFKMLVTSVPLPELDEYNHCKLIYHVKTDSQYYIDSYYGTEFIDIDRDGKIEKCCLGMGRTSGLFSFTVTIYEDGEKEYHNMFVADWGDLSWVRQSGLGVQVRSNDGETKVYKLSLKKHRIILECDGEVLEGYAADPTLEFSLTWNTYGISSYDSRTGELVKTVDAENPDDFVTTMFLPTRQIQTLRVMLENMDLEAYPYTYDPFNAPDAEIRQMCTPSQNIILTVYSGGSIVRRIECRDVLYFGMAEGYDENAEKFIEFCKVATDFIYATEEWKALPEYEVLYE
ncbi:MAG: hypothetical protein IKM29_04140 [Clostridia bacterium]|nr:hypothetical protein [Clostridia bacterium]